MVGVAKSGVSTAVQSVTSRIISVGDVTALHVRARPASAQEDARAQPGTLPNSFMHHASSLHQSTRRLRVSGAQAHDERRPPRWFLALRGRDRRVHQRRRHYFDGERVVNRTRNTRQPHVGLPSCAPYEAEMTALFECGMEARSRRPASQPRLLRRRSKGGPL
jgi:hypothetical protein